MIENADEQLIRKLNGLFSGARINISRITSSSEYNLLNKQNVRDKAKDRIRHIVSSIEASTGVGQIDIYRSLYKAYCFEKYENSTPEIKRLFGQVFNAW